jgi:hypothetical protein
MLQGLILRVVRVIVAVTAIVAIIAVPVAVAAAVLLRIRVQVLQPSIIITKLLLLR